jgi:hypothetical protein
MEAFRRCWREPGSAVASWAMGERLISSGFSRDAMGRKEGTTWSPALAGLFHINLSVAKMVHVPDKTVAKVRNKLEGLSENPNNSVLVATLSHGATGTPRGKAESLGFPCNMTRQEKGRR